MHKLLLTTALLFTCQLALADQHHSWNYDDQKWGDLCDSGTQQSPIDITDTTAAKLAPLTLRYKTSIATPSRGYNLTLHFDNSDNTLRVTGDHYVLDSLHFHSPSEHSVDGKSYPLEAHLVHENNDDQLAVVGIFFEAGDTPSPWFETFLNAFSTQDQKAFSINPAELLPSNLNYYSYAGSLTTPPCSEGLAWFVLKTPQKVSAEQVERFIKILGGENARKMQPLNERIIIEGAKRNSSH